jgi:hypothetical protein
MSTQTVKVVQTKLEDVLLLEINSLNYLIVNNDLLQLCEMLDGKGILLNHRIAELSDIWIVVTEVINAKWFAEFHLETGEYVVSIAKSEYKRGDVVKLP